MIAFAGDVKLTDFGIAKARGFLQDQEGEVIAGKADYMSPEQADFGSPISVRIFFQPGSCWRICCSATIFSRAKMPR